VTVESISVVIAQDLSAYINEVKRDNETLHMINEIENRYIRSSSSSHNTCQYCNFLKLYVAVFYFIVRRFYFSD